ncbi:uncharacterized protein TRIADDRAFT_62498 [Trichoplax adhaerens]|uniref:Uncharacterized protein n=1 Tax=Trichoplax adhaerens TaxID=10228 RepID=B3SDZ5_TRIAD|nr:hypothetical protein TRIADDRAFT_62498 [Trichoplax adhaerens]EDV19049.1 hypothetical protein TRIADDRAFT_62498 [Trichoplax adhaerens]|eukprot:XP_002118464.1 hypothetical protein TRIADDRAFT_62498 [Trichoplax adhaerens]
MANRMKNQVYIADCIDRQGDIKRMTGDESGALSDFRISLDMKLKSLDGDNLSIGDTYHKIGRAYFSQKEYNKALLMYQKALDIRIRKLGDDVIVAQSYHNIGLAYSNLGMLDDAINMNKKSLEINLAKLDNDHYHVTTSYDFMGNLYKKKGAYKEALAVFRKSLEIRLQRLGSNDVSVASSYRNIGLLHRSAKQNNQAIRMLEKAIEILTFNYGENHRNIANIYNEVATCYSHLHQKDVAANIRRKADSIRKILSHSPQKNSHRVFQPLSHVSRQSEGTGIQSKNYLKAYNRAIKQGKRRNNLIRAMFVGPRNVGKSSIIRVFTQQRLSGHDSPTQVVEWSERMIKINAYDIYDGKFCAMSEILEKNVIASIEESPQVTKELDDNPNFKKQIIETPVLNSKDAKEDRKYAKIWDFGGHSVYHVTHRPFMSANNIYILVFNITQNINDHVKTRHGLLLTTNYLQAMQEWLTSIISGHRDPSDISINIDGVPVKYSLPIVILVASHGDSLDGKEDGNRRFKQFEQDLISYMPTYKRNIYSSGIIFNCKPEDNNLATISQRRECCRRLHLIIKEFVLSLFFIRNPIPIRWYIMATILNTSFHRYENQESSSVIDQIRAARVRDIMTMQDVTLLAQDYTLYENHK